MIRKRVQPREQERGTTAEVHTPDRILQPHPYERLTQTRTSVGVLQMGLLVPAATVLSEGSLVLYLV